MQFGLNKSRKINNKFKKLKIIHRCASKQIAREYAKYKVYEKYNKAGENRYQSFIALNVDESSDYIAKLHFSSFSLFIKFTFTILIYLIRRWLSNSFIGELSQTTFVLPGEVNGAHSTEIVSKEPKSSQ